ncbi:hypothetical protein F2Q70_00035634 [Brassica cretica]|uniref:Uncharacterized protein n=1 Tax=Brassica cretica TaxID=69181 RepID=A0A8S9JWY0_BRACR|nr:hypothetical protein F2Q68_00034025 [Brassica cretica]KAF2586412.1 hypothetical protein F2Q70_00035634 [Brassica cretica]
MRYELIEPKERSHGLNRNWLELSWFWLDHQSWLVKLAGRDGLQFGQFEHLVEDLDAAPIRTFVGRADTRPGQSV